MKKPILLVAVLVVLLASAGIALAQEEPAATYVAGVLEKPGYTPEGYGPYAITDEATGVRYVVDYGWEYLDSGGEQYLGKVLGLDLDSFVGYRFTVNGPVIEGSEPPVLLLPTQSLCVSDALVQNVYEDACLASTAGPETAAG